MVAPGGGCFRSEDRGESRSQVLQGLLSLLRVTVIAVAVGPLAKGLVDAHVSLRVGQTLLISGEEAKQSLDPRLGLGRHSRVGNGWRLGYLILLFDFFTLIVCQLFLQQKHLGLELVPFM